MTAVESDEDLSFLNELLRNELLHLDTPLTATAQAHNHHMPFAAAEEAGRASSAEPVQRLSSPSFEETTFLNQAAFPHDSGAPGNTWTLGTASRGNAPFHGRSLSEPGDDVGAFPSASVLAVGSVPNPGTLLSGHPAWGLRTLVAGAGTPASDHNAWPSTVNVAQGACDLTTANKQVAILPERRMNGAMSQSSSPKISKSSSPMKTQEQSISALRRDVSGITKKSATEKMRRGRVSQGFENLREAIPREFLNSHIQKTRGFTQKADLCTLLNGASEYIEYMKAYKSRLEAQLSRRNLLKPMSHVS